MKKINRKNIIERPKLKAFEKPIYVTRPLLPSIDEMTGKLKVIWESQWLTNNGAQHQMLEKKMTEALKVSNVSLFNNGTIALIVACQNLDLKGEVITTPFTFPATTHVLSWNRLTPVFCDIDPVTMNIDADKIEALITPRTSAILAVHVFGTPCDVEKIGKIAKKHNLKVIYDAAHAFGVEINGRGIANFGDISMFSFHATKLFHTAEGGALAYTNKKYKKQIDLLKNFGIADEETIILPGINGKMNEIQAALGLVTLKYVNDERKKRELIKKEYIKQLFGLKGISFLPEIKGVRNSYQYFVVRIDEKMFGRSRDYLYEKFKKFNVFTRKYFYPLCSQYECYAYLNSAKKEKLPVANKVVKEVLAMPFFGGLKVKDVKKICQIIKMIHTKWI